MTLNIHYLLHLPMCVRNLGPLWCQSCFPFETVPSAVKTQYRLWTPESYKCNLIYFIRSEINTIYTET